MEGWTLLKMKGDREPYWRKPGVTAGWDRATYGPPPYTASIDAALALVERKLPGWSLQLYRHPDGVYATLYRLGEITHFPKGGIERRVTTPYFEGIRPQDAQAPLAILAALLRALANQETDRGNG